MTTAGITIGESNIGERDYYANVDTVLDDDEEDEEDDIHRNYTNTNKEKLKRIPTLRRRMTTTTSVDFVVLLLLLEPVTTTTAANRTAALRSQDFGAPQCTCSAAAVQFSVEYCTAAAVTSRVAEAAAAVVAGTEWHLTRYLLSYFILSWQGHPIRQYLFISKAHTSASSSFSLSSLGGTEVMLKQCCQIAFYARVLVILTAIKQKDLPPPRRGESPSWPLTAQWGPCCRTSTADCGR